MTKLNPYINFKNNAREAMEFYKTVFGGKLDMTTFKDGGVPCDPKEENNIMHSVLEAGNGITFMAADIPSGMEYRPGTNMSMSLSGEDENELRGYWEKLSVDASIEQPLSKAPWGDTFGMLTDKVGIHWMVNITAKKAS
jgi:PhnB protein